MCFGVILIVGGQLRMYIKTLTMLYVLYFAPFCLIRKQALWHRCPLPHIGQYFVRADVSFGVLRLLIDLFFKCSTVGLTPYFMG